MQEKQPSHDRSNERHKVRSRMNPQCAARLRVQSRDYVVGLLEIGQDFHASLVVGLPDFREADLPRCPIQKSRAKLPLQVLHMAAHHSGRHT